MYQSQVTVKLLVVVAEVTVVVEVVGRRDPTDYFKGFIPRASALYSNKDGEPLTDVPHTETTPPCAGTTHAQAPRSTVYGPLWVGSGSP